MTALRVFATANPSLIGAKVQPMSEDDRRFWQAFHARKKPMEEPSWLARLFGARR